MRLSLRPGLLVATAFALAVLCSLGAWQLRRLEWKRALIEATEQKRAAAPMPFDEAAARADAGEKMDYQPVYLDGAFANDLESLVFGTYEGAPGVYVFTPLATRDPAAGLRDSGRRFIYVNRGFAPQDFRDPETRRDGVVEGDIRVEGLFRSAEVKRGFEKWLQPKDQPEDNLYFVRDPRVIAAEREIEAPPYYVDSFGRENAGAWPKGDVTRVEFSNRHLEYALTWFGLAAALIGVFAVYSLKRD